ncbi:protein YgfX [Candidatus Ferrigenium straubiae]|jgi:hypothetical protein|uniref:protein YgfX n=1 Tax=Candidatus Ferrigenium straubiae TaxID=2919506 RepID=UPI003F4AC5BE
MALQTSLRLAVLLLLSHMLVATVVCLTAVPPIVRLALLVTILLSLFYYLVRDALLLLPGSWRKISLDQDSVSVTTRGGSTLSGKITGGTAVTPYFAVLRIRPEGRYFRVSRTIFSDMLGKDEFRDLRVRLRFSRKLF